MAIGENRSVLVYDIETNSLNVDEAKVKWFGAYSFFNNKYYFYRGDTQSDEIVKLINKHKVLVGFNNEDFDNPILINDLLIDFKYKVIVDLFKVSKKRLPMMGIKPKNYKLKTIIETLQLDKSNKGDIDYKIFQKDDWSNAEIYEIKDYLKQDIVITKKLFEWFFEQFKPIRGFLNAKDKKNYNDIKTSTASLAYRVICNQVGLLPEFRGDDDVDLYDEDEDDEDELDEESECQDECEFDRQKEQKEQKEHKKIEISGGHHINNRKFMIKGNIVSVDVVSMYPHCIMMGNLLSPIKDKKQKHNGWNGNEIFNLGGVYKKDELGKKEKALRNIFLERLKAKKEGDKLKANSYKIIINSFYGSLGHTAFKHVYNPVSAGDCTSMARTIIKLLAKWLEESGFEVIYGFTDSVSVVVSDNFDKTRLMKVVQRFVKYIKNIVPFPQDTFDIEVEKEMKFLWIIAKNCYLWVNMDDTIGYRTTLFNKNTPKLIMRLFEEYISPKIIRELDVSFTDSELREELKRYLKNDITNAAEEYEVKALENYSSKTSLQYQISEAYGEGHHKLIPNLKLIGVGKAKGTKKKCGVRYCTIEEFNENGLTYEDVSMEKMMKNIKPFVTKSLLVEDNQQKLNFA